MEVGYTFRFSDYNALCEALRSQKYRDVYSACFWLAVSGQILAAIWVLPTDSANFAWIFTAFAAILLLNKFVLIKWRRRRAFGMYDLEGQRLRIVFGDDKVFISEKRGESTAKWSAFVRLSEEKSHAFLWTNKRQAIVVPFDSFMSLGQRDAFLILARSKIGISA